MRSVQINKATLKFLKDLSKNNNREWFLTHKDQYLIAQANALEFFDKLKVVGEARAIKKIPSL